ncbi:MAG: hypothetical protein EOP84_20670 [Verrucomicrobiaceae bacterium]|nr:MAG: hypothetical protein EOP84_20670 [Verrucomicrobiaceae bacterium]
MKLFATLAALLVSLTSAQAEILIFDGPAPTKSYGSETEPKRNHAMLVYDTTAGQFGIINYFGKRKQRKGEQDSPIRFAVNGGTIPIKRGSMTVLTGVSYTMPEGGDFDSRMVSLRGKNSLLNRTTDLTGPRILSGIARITNRTGAVLVHWEQSFSAVYESKLSDAANTEGDSFEEAIDRVTMVLQNRGYFSLRK